MLQKKSFSTVIFAFLLAFEDARTQRPSSYAFSIFAGNNCDATIGHLHRSS